MQNASMGSLQEGLGAGVGDLQIQRGGDQREPRGAFSLAEGSTRQVLNQGAEE